MRATISWLLAVLLGLLACAGCNTARGIVKDVNLGTQFVLDHTHDSYGVKEGGEAQCRER